jgi:hypothetical protein
LNRSAGDPVLVNFPREGRGDSPFRFIFDYTCFLRQKSYSEGELEDRLRREDMSVAILEYMFGTMGQQPRKKREEYG